MTRLAVLWKQLPKCQAKQKAEHRSSRVGNKIKPVGSAPDMGLDDLEQPTEQDDGSHNQ